jgi:4-hydroxyphenylacetate 3-monooxygenase oxygenase component
MGIRNGRELIESLRDGREVYANGVRIEDVTAYPAFRGIVTTLAALYDLQCAQRDELTFRSPSSGDAVAAAFMMARTAAEVEFRSRAELIRADFNYGLMGRMPDFCNAMVTDLATGADIIGERDRRLGENMVRYYEKCREEDLCLTHTLIDPQADRSRGPAEQADPFLTMRPVRETDRGVIVRGAKMLSTLAPFANELLVAPFIPRKPGEEDYALAFAIPCNTPGLKFICREPYDDGRRSDFDRPLTSHYDEQDALAVFDDVMVPWERVFVYRDIEIYNSIMSRSLGYTQLQACIRGFAKLKFLTGLACHIAETIGRSEALHVKAQLGELVANVELVKGLVRAGAAEVAEAKAAMAPPLAISATLWVMIPKAQMQVNQAIRELSGGGLILTPGESDFANPAIARYLESYMRAKNSSARDRVRLFKLAWDIVGTEFGSRQNQYEWFYAGDPYFTRSRFYGLPTVNEYKQIVSRLLERGEKRR